MNRRFGMVSRLVGGLSLVAAAVFPLVGHAEEISRGKTGAWDIRCQPAAGGRPEQCGLTQLVRAEDKAGVNLAVILVRSPGAKTAVMRVIAPLSVYLVNGVGMKVDQTDVGRLPFFRCSPAGCITEAPIDEKLLDQMRNGKIATLVIYVEPEEGLRHLVRLEGLKEGLEKLH